jgi:Protein of unknown function (DUF3300)
MWVREIRSIVSALVLLAPICATAQTSPPALLKPEELNQLVAPIALYPDTLLSEVLMASAYPLDVVQAERWLQSNTNLKGDALKAAVDKQSWDASIKSLVATPSVLEMMSTQLDWTQKLGDAVVAQQSDVMDAIQRLRAKAQANNKLTSTKEQTVTHEQVQGREVIAIAPTQSDTVYVPYYDPGVVYGEWPYADYPPYYFGAPAYLGGFLATGLAFGAGYALGRWAGGGYWGGGVNWNGNNITINRPGGGAGAGNWRPNVAHHNRQVGNRGGLGGRGNLGQGLGGRGNLGQGLGGRGNLGQGNRPGNRPGAGNRPSRGQVAHRGGNRGGGATGGGRGGARGGRGGAHVAHRGGRGGGGMRAGGGRGGGGMRAAGGRGGGGMRGGGGRGGGGRGGGRRSDVMLKHDIVLLGHLDNGLGFYRFSYNGSNKAYVGVMAQEVQQVMPQAVARGPDGYLTVNYDKLGLKFESYDRWIKAGARIPAAPRLNAHRAP